MTRPHNTGTIASCSVGAGGNLGLSIGEYAVLVIDDQFAPLTPKLEAAIAKLTAKPVKFVLSTHWHFDHDVD